MTRGKDVYNGTLECFIYVLICHVPVFHELQLHNNLQKINMSCIAHHLDILFGLKWTCGLVIHSSYISNNYVHSGMYVPGSFTYHLRTKCSTLSKIMVKFIKKHPTFSFAAARATSLHLNFYITGTLSFFNT
jgi:hypothetical protein